MHKREHPTPRGGDGANASAVVERRAFNSCDFAEAQVAEPVTELPTRSLNVGDVLVDKHKVVRRAQTRRGLGCAIRLALEQLDGRVAQHCWGGGLMLFVIGGGRP